MARGVKETLTLTWKQSLFVDFYIENGGNATKAAIKAGYAENSAQQIGSENLSKPLIIAAIERRREGLAKTLDQVAWQIAEIMPEKLRRAGLKDCATALNSTVTNSRLLRDKATSITGTERDAEYWNKKAEKLAKKHNRPLEEVKEAMIARKPELASLLIH